MEIDIHVFIHNGETGLTEISHKLDKLITMAVSQADFDTALAGVVTDISTQTALIDTTVQAIIDKIGAAGNPVDLTAELATLGTIQTGLDGIAAQLPTTVTPPTP